MGQTVRLRPSRAAIIAVQKPHNIHEEVRIKQHDEDFIPMPCRQACEAAAGSKEKIEAMRQRVDDGEEIFHPDDQVMHATHEQQQDSQNWIRDCLLNSDSNAKHIQQRRASFARRIEIQSNPLFVTKEQLVAELKVSHSSVSRWLWRQNPRFELILGQKYYLRSSLRSYP